MGHVVQEARLDELLSNLDGVAAALAVRTAHQPVYDLGADEHIPAALEEVRSRRLGAAWATVALTAPWHPLDLPRRAEASLVLGDGDVHPLCALYPTVTVQGPGEAHR